MNLRPPRPERGALPDCATLRSTGGGLIASAAPRCNSIEPPICGNLTKRCHGAPSPVGSPPRQLRRAPPHSRRQRRIGASPSGKAAVFGTAIPRFESWRPSQCVLFQKSSNFNNLYASPNGVTGPQVCAAVSGLRLWMTVLAILQRWLERDSYRVPALPALASGGRCSVSAGKTGTGNGNSACSTKPF